MTGTGSAFAAQVGITVLYLLLFGVVLWLAKRLKDWLTPYKLLEELIKRDNPAVGLMLGGYLIGVACAFVGAVIGPSQGFWWDLLLVLGYAALGVLFLNVSRLVMDRLLFTRLSSLVAITEQQNLAVAAVRAGIYVATGLVAGGAVSGQGGGVLSAVVFFALGQGLVFALAHLYDAITPFDLEAEIQRGNTAAGVAFSGTLMAMGLIMMDAVSGDFIGWSDSLWGFGREAVTGLVLLVVVRQLVDRALVPGDDLNREIAEDGNLAAGFAEAAVALAFAGVLVALL